MEDFGTTVVSRALARIEELDDQAIIQAVSGRVSEKWVYRFEQRNGSVIEDLSVVGVEQAARESAIRGEAIRELDVQCVYEDDKEARFVARAGRYAVSSEGQEVLLDVAIRAKRVTKFMRLRNGGQQFDEHWFEKGIAKANRNAKKALLADEVRQYILKQANQGGKKAAHVHREAVEEPPEPTPPGETVEGQAREMPATFTPHERDRAFVSPSGDIDVALFTATLSERRLRLGELAVVAGGGPKKATADGIAAWLREYLQEPGRSITELIEQAAERKAAAPAAERRR
jgi:hypothetical protein